MLGATGFVGRHVVDACTAAGHDVLGVSRSASRTVRGATAHVDLAAATVGDLTDFLAAHRPDILVNAAGTVWQADEQRMRELNDTFVHRLVTALAEHATPVRLVHLGTVHEYGPASAGIYGRTKLRGTKRVLAASRDGLDAVTLRLANACGPGAPSRSLLGKVAGELARQDEPGPGSRELRLAPLTAHRDFVDVRDVADAALAAAVAPRDAVRGRIIEVGRGQAVSVRLLVRRLVDLSGVAVRLVEDQRPDGARVGAEWQRTDITTARRLLAWCPSRTLDASLRDLLESVRRSGEGHRRPGPETGATEVVTFPAAAPS
ncbi:NAD(P)-dependent oxidoreductase [Streptomyces sp. NPDC046939]|uniref:NAD-dependent epimerase/dehydratase family protein n=1 Tax=Streptomyces sp. NPDC046939 TaxID=3155376 RepID=UPI0033F8E3A8